MAYYNTNKETGESLKKSWEQARSQEEVILRFFEHYPYRSFTPFEVQEEIRILQGKEWPITSVRRAMTDLTNDDRLIKVNSVMKAGKYGKPNHMWRLARY
jgi:hypothetical protein|tara:strand:+ start:1629 stop:1928 length:300 start_codon:yes stop_codon:yes gene_type:complete